MLVPPRQTLHSHFHLFAEGFPIWPVKGDKELHANDHMVDSKGLLNRTDKKIYIL